MTFTKSSVNEKQEEDTTLPYTEAETEYSSIAGDEVHLKRETNTDYVDEDDHESFREYEYDSAHKPLQPPFYRRKRVLVTCAIGTVVFLAIFVPLLILVIIPKIAQSLLNTSQMEILQLNMTNPGESALTVSVAAQVKGIPKIFSAELIFTDTIMVHWEDQAIGSMNLDPVQVKGGKGDILQSTGFTIQDKAAFAAFAKTMVSHCNSFLGFLRPALPHLSSLSSFSLSS